MGELKTIRRVVIDDLKPYAKNAINEKMLAILEGGSKKATKKPANKPTKPNKKGK